MVLSRNRSSRLEAHQASVEGGQVGFDICAEGVQLLVQRAVSLGDQLNPSFEALGHRIEIPPRPLAFLAYLGAHLGYLGVHLGARCERPHGGGQIVFGRQGWQNLLDSHDPISEPEGQDGSAVAEPAAGEEWRRR